MLIIYFVYSFSYCALSLFDMNVYLWDKAAFPAVCLAQCNHAWEYLSQYKHCLNAKDQRQTGNSAQSNKRCVSKYYVSGKDRLF